MLTILNIFKMSTFLGRYCLLSRTRHMGTTVNFSKSSVCRVSRRKLGWKDLRVEQDAKKYNSCKALLRSFLMMGEDTVSKLEEEIKNNL